MKVNEIEQILDEKLQKSVAMSWDNVGLLIGDRNRKVRRMLLALELTEPVLQEAIAKNVDFILVHHPLIFSGLKRVINTESPLVYKLITNGIALYAAHTNFDMIEGGLNDYLATELGAKNIRCIEDEEGSCLLRIFEVPDISVEKFANNIKEKLGLTNIRAVGDRDRIINRIGLVTGAGFDYAELAIRHGAEMFVSGDLKYHMAMSLKEKGISLLDVGHYETEAIFSKAMEKFIRTNISPLSEIELIISQQETAPMEFV